MGTVLLIVIAILLFGAGGGYWGFRQYGGPGVGTAIVLVVVAFFVVWLAGGVNTLRGDAGSPRAPIWVILGIH